MTRWDLRSLLASLVSSQGPYGMYRSWFLVWEAFSTLGAQSVGLLPPQGGPSGFQGPRLYL